MDHSPFRCYQGCIRKGGGVGRTPPPPPMVPAKGGPKILMLKSSWHRRRRSQLLAVSLKHWKGRKRGEGGGGPGGGLPLNLLLRTAVLIHPWGVPRPALCHGPVPSVLKRRNQSPSQVLLSPPPLQWPVRPQKIQAGQRRPALATESHTAWHNVPFGHPVLCHASLAFCPFAGITVPRSARRFGDTVLPHK